MTQWDLRNATAADREAVKFLLDENDLPAADIDEHLQCFLVAIDNGIIVGVVGAEISGTEALLRSLAVRVPDRGKGLGGILSNAILSSMKQMGVKQVALLTTTAEKFFANHGFITVPKTQIPEFVKASKEYRLYCPSTAVCMIKQLA
ncbi:MAG: GNAT family N-acetyltransferase [Ignavibacteriales bacterium]|nr:GNAT family N-acetyltransferase [Ignavibacteriales bacterium]